MSKFREFQGCGVRVWLLKSLVCSPGRAAILNTLPCINSDVDGNTEWPGGLVWLNTTLS